MAKKDGKSVTQKTIEAVTKAVMSPLTTLVETIVDAKLASDGIYKSYQGNVISTNGQTEDPAKQRCNVDLQFAIVEGIINKSGEILQEGDGVVVFEKVGSNFVDTVIMFKNNTYTLTPQEEEEDVAQVDPDLDANPVEDFNGYFNTRNNITGQVAYIYSNWFEDIQSTATGAPKTGSFSISGRMIYQNIKPYVGDSLKWYLVRQDISIPRRDDGEPTQNMSAVEMIVQSPSLYPTGTINVATQYLTDQTVTFNLVNTNTLPATRSIMVADRNSPGDFESRTADIKYVYQIVLKYTRGTMTSVEADQAVSRIKIKNISLNVPSGYPYEYSKEPLLLYGSEDYPIVLP